MGNIPGKSLQKVNAVSVYWRCVYARSKGEYDAALTELRVLHDEAAAYLDGNVRYYNYLHLLCLQLYSY